LRSLTGERVKEVKKMSIVDVPLYNNEHRIFKPVEILIKGD
jgi:hypothetical protein